MPGTGKSALPLIFSHVLALVNVAAITSTLGCNVYREVPQTPSYPFLTLQSPTENRDGAFNVPAKTGTVQCHIYTSSEQWEGTAQVSGIASKVCELTEYPTIVESGWTIQLRSEDVLDVGDETHNGIKYRHWVVPVRFWATPTA